MEVWSVKIEHAVNVIEQNESSRTKMNLVEQKWISLNKNWKTFLSLHVILALKQGAHLIEYGMFGKHNYTAIKCCFSAIIKVCRYFVPVF